MRTRAISVAAAVLAVVIPGAAHAGGRLYLLSEEGPFWQDARFPVPYDVNPTSAVGNITGAMVFQSTLPVAIGLAFTPWELDRYSIVAGCLALAGGLVAVVTLHFRRRFSWQAIVAWAALYAAFVVYVAVSS